MLFLLKIVAISLSLYISTSFMYTDPCNAQIAPIVINQEIITDIGDYMLGLNSNTIGHIKQIDETHWEIWLTVEVERGLLYHILPKQNQFSNQEEAIESAIQLSTIADSFLNME